MPHTASLHNDLTTLAQHLVSAGTFASATVGNGGITATLKDGTQTLIVADHPEALGYIPGITPSPAARLNARRRNASFPAGISNASASHDIVFLCDTQDTTLAFDCDRQASFFNAFKAAAPINADGNTNVYSIDGGDASLDNVIALGKTHNVDLFSIQAHGYVIGTGTNLAYVWESTTPVNLTTKVEYLQDILLGNIVASITLQYTALGTGGTLTGAFPRWAFKPSFLTEYMAFNNGAIFDNEASFGTNSSILSYVEGPLRGAGIGSYLGWSKEVPSIDSDQTAAFIYDRMLGEFGTGPWLTPFADQHTPPQRPFDLDDVFGAAQGENRAGPLGPGELNGLRANGESYASSDISNPDNKLAPPAGSTTSSWTPEVLNPAEPLDEYNIPSIAGMNMTTEGFSGGTLAINGKFPATPGTGFITDSTGTVTPLALTWGTSTITAPLPATGNETAGSITIESADGFLSNSVPLTQWSGTLTYHENDQFDNLNGTSGSGSGGLQVQFNLTFRGDVHPTVPAIDQSPVPQKLYFPEVEGNSTAVVTALNGSFTSSEGTPPPAMANFSISSTTTQMLPVTAAPLADDTFIVGAYAGQPAPCTDSSPGPAGADGSTTFCPAFGYKPSLIGICTDTDPNSGLCGFQQSFSPGGSLGAAGLIDQGLVTFAIDPGTYAVTVDGPDTSFIRPFGSSNWNADATLSGTIGAPVSPPTSTTPAIRTRSTIRRGGPPIRKIMGSAVR
jgi:hypothetical protein